MVLSLPLLSCESPVSVKENPDRKKKKKKYTTLFLLCLKINDPQAFKSRNCKNPFFKRGCYWYNFIRWTFFIPCDNWKTLLFMKVYPFSVAFFNHVLNNEHFDASFVASISKEVRFLCVKSTITVQW